MKLNHLALLATICFTTASCKKDSDEDPTPTPTPIGTGTVKLSFTFRSGAAPFDMSSFVLDGAGNSVQFDTLKFYASDFHLTNDADVTVAEFHETVLLADAAAASNEFTLGSMNLGHVHEAHITLGLDSEMNASDPASAESPLDAMDMYLGSGLGYRFLKMSGRIDGNGDGDVSDPEDVIFQYSGATDALLRETHVHIHADVTGGSTVTMEAQVDVAKLLSGLDLLTTPIALVDQPGSITAMDSLAVAIDEL